MRLSYLILMPLVAAVAAFYVFGVQGPTLPRRFLVNTGLVNIDGGEVAVTQSAVSATPAETEPEAEAAQTTETPDDEAATPATTGEPGNPENDEQAEQEAEGEGEAEKPKAPALPGIKLDLEKKEVRMEAEIVLDEGLLEYLVCLPNTFEHESIFLTRTKPEFLHLALLLVGAQPFPLRNPLWWIQHPKQPKSQLRVQVEWEEGGETARLDLHKMLVPRTGDDMDYPGYDAIDRDDEEGEGNAVVDSWVFAGSFFYKRDDKNIYAANVDGVVVGIWPMSSSVVQYGKQTENPYHGENSGLAVNNEICPRVGTKVNLVFSPRKPAAKADAPDTPDN